MTWDGSTEAIIEAVRTVCGLSEPTARLLADEMVIDATKLIAARSLDGQWEQITFSFAVKR